MTGWQHYQLVTDGGTFNFDLASQQIQQLAPFNNNNDNNNNNKKIEQIT